MKQLLLKHKDKLILISLLLVISMFSHSFNMFHYPYFENDEGTYMSQAWSLLTHGKLAPYTYWYDHPPAGWIFIAFWIKLTHGFFTFGPALNSGRVFMSLIHLLNTLLIFYISHKVTRGNLLASTLAVIFFSLSPLGTYFQRRILLDNLMVFWVLLSISILLKKRLKLSTVVLSAITFAVSVLTKENAIFFLPGFVLVLLRKTAKSHRSFAVVCWIFVTALIISLYPLYALLNQELFSSADRVSLINTLSQQISRGKGLAFYQKSSDFLINLGWWLKMDPLTIAVGSLAVVVNTILSLKRKDYLIVTLFAILFSLFLISGSLIIDFYIIPLLPFLAINSGIVVAYALKKIQKRGAIIISILPIVLFLIGSYPQFSKDETTAQMNAIKWLQTNVPYSKNIIIDNALFVDLGKYPNADWFWKVEKDKEILNEKLNADWRNVDYLVLSHEMLKQMRLGELPFVAEVLANSHQVALWNNGSTSYLDVKNRLSTNGDWMAVYKIDDESRTILKKSWHAYKEKYILNDGQVIDLNKNQTTSEGQSYAMLQAVWIDDQETFDRVWKWAQDHLQYRREDKLFSWLWKDGKVADFNTASDADGDIALALIFAYKRWGEVGYLDAARIIMADIWRREVKIAGEYYVLTMSTDSKRGDLYIINPSYFSPATYRVFATIDPLRNWQRLADDSYAILRQTSLPSDWALINGKSGKLSSASKYIQGMPDEHDYDAFRTYWRVALDYKWFNKDIAYGYLQKASEYWKENWEGLDVSRSAGPLAIFAIIDRSIALEIYEENIKNQKDLNYYDSNWAWFGKALYFDLLANYLE